jgi:hypothetical protein
MIVAIWRFQQITSQLEFLTVDASSVFLSWDRKLRFIVLSR